MSEHNPRPLAELIDPGWARALTPVEGRIHELGTMLAAEVEAGHGYLPAGTDVLRAFTYPFDKVKVLIVGQDPYPTPGHAMGLSFSVHPGVALPKSLIKHFPRAERGHGRSRSDVGRPDAVERAGRVPAEPRVDGAPGCSRIASRPGLGGGDAVRD